MIVSTTNVTKRFGGIVAVDQVSIDCGSRSITGVIGPNGAGKSTLVGLICGQLEADHGAVFIDDDDVTHMRSDQRCRLGLSRTFQRVRLFEGLTCYENIRLGTQIADGGASHIGSGDGVLSSLVEGFDLLKYANQLPSVVPFGTQKLLAMARALATEPDFLVLDEPFAGLTDEDIERVTDVMVSLRDDFGMGLLVVEHNLDALAAFADSLIALNRGRVVAQGASDDVLSHPEVHEAYFGSHDRRAMKELVSQWIEKAGDGPDYTEEEEQHAES